VKDEVDHDIETLLQQLTSWASSIDVPGGKHSPLPKRFDSGNDFGYPSREEQKPMPTSEGATDVRTLGEPEEATPDR
jgi:hypothetical protein